MQAPLQEVRAFATSIFQQAVENAPINPIYVWERGLENFNNHTTHQEPLHQLFPEVLEYRPPGTIVNPKPTCFIHNLSQCLLFRVFQYYLYDEEEDDYRTKHTEYQPNYNSMDFRARAGLGASSNKYKPALTANLSSSASPVTLFSVCKRWRSFYDIPSLWASLAVFKPRSEQLPEIVSWLGRSLPEGTPETTRKVPLLSLYLHAPHGDQGSDKAVIESVLRLFLSPHNTKRMQHLTVKLAGRFINPVPIFHAPYLQSVELDFERADDWPSTWNSICRRAPGIRKVSWRPILLSILTGPYTMSWELLTHMKLPFSQYFSPEILLHELMLALIHCVNLVDLEIVMPLPLKDEESPMIKSYNYRQQTDSLRCVRAIRARETRYIDWNKFRQGYSSDQNNLLAALKGHIDLPRLRHLKVEALKRDAAPFLDRITAPSLCSLEIIHSQRDRSFFYPSTASIVFFLERSKSPLTSLSLYDPDMPKKETLRLVSIPLPDLRHLELCVAPIGNRIMCALMIFPDSETDLMPNLRKLVLPECIVSNGHLADMVMSRIQHSTLKELRMSLPPAIKTDPDLEMWTMSKKQYNELRSLRELTSNLREEEFKLTVD